MATEGRATAKEAKEARGGFTDWTEMQIVTDGAHEYNSFCVNVRPSSVGSAVCIHSICLLLSIIFSFSVLKAVLFKDSGSPFLTVHLLNKKKQTKWWKAQPPWQCPEYKMWLEENPLSKYDEWASVEVLTAKLFWGIGELLKGRSGCDVVRPEPIH